MDCGSIDNYISLKFRNPKLKEDLRLQGIFLDLPIHTYNYSLGMPSWMHKKGPMLTSILAFIVHE
jgi:hypothetical protein